MAIEKKIEAMEEGAIEKEATVDDEITIGEMMEMNLMTNGQRPSNQVNLVHLAPPHQEIFAQITVLQVS